MLPYWFEPWGLVAQQGWGQLSPRCHHLCHLCCRGERRGRCSPSPCGLSFWPEAQAGYPQSSVQLPGLVMSTKLLDLCRRNPELSTAVSHPAAAHGPKERPLGMAVRELLLFLPRMKVVTLLQGYLSPKQRPWSFLLPRFSVQVTPHN